MLDLLTIDFCLDFFSLGSTICQLVWFGFGVPAGVVWVWGGVGFLMSCFFWIFSRLVQLFTSCFCVGGVFDVVSVLVCSVGGVFPRFFRLEFWVFCFSSGFSWAFVVPLVGVAFCCVFWVDCSVWSFCCVLWCFGCCGLLYITSSVALSGYSSCLLLASFRLCIAAFLWLLV